MEHPFIFSTLLSAVFLFDSAHLGASSAMTQGPIRYDSYTAATL